jgi:hypothetical protein
MNGRQAIDAWQKGVQEKKQLVRELAERAVGAVFSPDDSRVLTWMRRTFAGAFVALGAKPVRRRSGHGG